MSRYNVSLESSERESSFAELVAPISPVPCVAMPQRAVLEMEDVSLWLRPGPLPGKGLEKLGNAVEYLRDRSLSVDPGPLAAARDPEAAIHLMKKLSRAIFEDLSVNVARQA